MGAAWATAVVATVHLSAEEAEIPLAGDRELEVTARTSDIDQTVFDRRARDLTARTPRSDIRHPTRA